MENENQQIELLLEKLEERDDRLRRPPCNLPPNKWAIAMSLLGDDLQDDRVWIEAVFDSEAVARSEFDAIKSTAYPYPGVIVKELWTPEDEVGLAGLESEYIVIPVRDCQ